MRGNLDFCFGERRQRLCPLYESAKLRSIHCRLAEESYINVPETRCVDSSHDVVQVLADAPIFEGHENRKNDVVITWCSQTEKGSARRVGKEMEGQ